MDEKQKRLKNMDMTAFELPELYLHAPNTDRFQSHYARFPPAAHLPRALQSCNHHFFHSECFVPCWGRADIKAVCHEDKNYKPVFKAVNIKYAKQKTFENLVVDTAIHESKPYIRLNNTEMIKRVKATAVKSLFNLINVHQLWVKYCKYRSALRTVFCKICASIK